MKKYVLAVNTVFNNSILTYVTKSDDEVYKRGQFVHVPLGKSKTTAVVLNLLQDDDQRKETSKELSEEQFKDIIGPIETKINFQEEELVFFEWLAKYYHYPLGKVIFESIPKLLVRPHRIQFEECLGVPFEGEMTAEQKVAFDGISSHLFLGFQKFLIHGVTGSGKSLVYLKIIQKVLSENKSVLFLVPEINLTPQFVDYFKKYLPNNIKIYSYHSSVSASDKYQLWIELQNNVGQAKLIIGVRSSIFLPLANLGLIVVDEEHDQSFKQSDRCPYNARDLAIKKASLYQFPVILGSATPLLETHQSFNEGRAKHHYFTLKQRARVVQFPKIELIDMREKNFTKEEKSLYYPFHPKSITAIQEALEKNEQVLVFNNRLGFSSLYQCKNCGHRFQCPNCEVQLKFFKRRKRLECSFCEYHQPLPEMCPECSSIQFLPMGFGTERVQDVLQSLIPKARIGRFDRDEITTMTQLENILEKFHHHELDIFVGTQMLSKGHNFERVNLVVILGIDGELNFPDFRSNERAYQTLVQVSGRSGRFHGDSRVLIQTLSPLNSVFQHVVKGSFDEFYEDEKRIRKLCHASPFSKMATITYSAKDQRVLVNEISKNCDALRSIIKKEFPQVELLGPRPSQIEKRVNRFHWLFLLRSTNLNQLHNLLTTYQDSFLLPYTISQKIDVDPYHID